MNTKFHQPNFFSVLLMYYIILQPILDVLTYFSMKMFGPAFTPGILVRFGMMVLLALYLIECFRKMDQKKIRKYLLYVVLLVLYLIIHLFVNYQMKNSFNLMTEIKAIAKSFYFIEFLVAYIFAFSDIAQSRRKIYEFFPKNALFAVFVINVVMLIATLTGTGRLSYGALAKIGHSGWFFAGNELSTILAMSFPVTLWSTDKNKTYQLTILWWGLPLLTMFSLAMVGTKAGYLATLVSLSFFVVGSLFEWKNRRKEKIYLLNLVCGIVVLATFFANTTRLPAYNNTHVQYELTEKKKEQLKEEYDKNKQEDDEFSTDSSYSDSFKVEADDVIYSGRADFLRLNKKYYEEAPSLQKVFGMGYGANYKSEPRIVERDSYDLFFQYGWIGTALYFLPLCVYAFKFIIRFLKHPFDFLNIKIIMIGTGILLGIGNAYIAGHTFVAPAVSTYLALLIAYFAVELGIL